MPYEDDASFGFRHSRPLVPSLFNKVQDNLEDLQGVVVLIDYAKS